MLPHSVQTTLYLFTDISINEIFSVYFTNWSDNIRPPINVVSERFLFKIEIRAITQIKEKLKRVILDLGKNNTVITLISFTSKTLFIQNL